MSAILADPIDEDFGTEPLENRLSFRWTMQVPWEIYASRDDALRSLASKSSNEGNCRIETPSFLVAHDICGVLCVEYDGDIWKEHIGELQALLRNLPSMVGRDRVILDFGGRDQHVGSATVSCIHCLYNPVGKMSGRFALTSLTKHMFDFFCWHNRFGARHINLRITD